jgi:uncharacterized protein YbjT (DUF2867 family)
MTILVTSANGTIGSRVAQQLLDRGDKVRIGARDVAKAQAVFPGAEAVAFDYADPARFPAAVAGVTAVFSAAPYWLLPDAEAGLARAAKDSGVERFVKLSAHAADGEETALHAAAEDAVEATGLSWTHLRPTFFMQNFANMHGASIRRDGVFYEASADQGSAFIDVRDIAAVAVAALTQPGHEGKIYVLTGPEVLTRAEVAALIAAAAGRRVRYQPVDDAALRGSLAGAPQVMIDLLSDLQVLVRAGRTATTTGTVRAILGRDPIRFEDFARDHAAAWR